MRYKDSKVNIRMDSEQKYSVTEVLEVAPSSRPPEAHRVVSRCNAWALGLVSQIAEASRLLMRFPSLMPLPKILVRWEMGTARFDSRFIVTVNLNTSEQETSLKMLPSDNKNAPKRGDGLVLTIWLWPAVLLVLLVIYWSTTVSRVGIVDLQGRRRCSHARSLFVGGTLLCSLRILGKKNSWLRPCCLAVLFNLHAAL